MGKQQLLQIFKRDLKWTAIACLLGWKKYLINLHHNFPEFASPHGAVVRHTLAQRENHTLNYIKKFRFGASKCNLLWFTKVKTRSSCPKCCARQSARRAVIHFEQGKRKKNNTFFSLFLLDTLEYLQASSTASFGNQNLIAVFLSRYFIKYDDCITIKV